MEIPLKARNKTTIWPSNTTPRNIPQGNQNWKKTHAAMFIAALFAIARTWKQPRCPSIDEWIEKLWYIYTMEYFKVKIKWSCSVLSDSLWPHGLSLPGSSVHGIFQARVLEGVAISFSTMEYYSAIKRSAFESVLMRWTNLEPIIRSEVSQKEK